MRLVPYFVKRLFKRQEKPVLEKLESIEDEILELETTRSTSLESEKIFVFRLLIYSLIVFGLSFIVVYYYYWPTTQSGKALLYTSLLVYPLIVSFLKWTFRKFFFRRISKTDERLKVLREAKQKLLEEVMEKETFNKAQQILKRFDPLMFASLSSVDNLLSETPRTSTKAPLVPGSESRLKSQKGFADGDNLSSLTMTPLQRITGNGKGVHMVEPTTPIQKAEDQTKPPLLRPILPRERSLVDRMIDALVGDGPDKRYALICQECSSHNGMALQEEFEYLAFRCCYCSHFNPPRRSRRPAPIPSNVALSHYASSPNVNLDAGSKADIRERRGSMPSTPTASAPQSPTELTCNGVEHASEESELQEDANGEITINGDAQSS